MDWLGWVAAGGGAVGAIAGAALAARAFQNARLVATVPPTPLSAMSPGLHETRGTLAGEDALVAPASRRPCLYFRFLVEELRGGRWETVVDVREARAATLEDGTGRASLDLVAAEVVVVQPHRARSGVLPAPGPELAELFARVGPPERAPAGPFVRWHEESLAAGDAVYVVGSAKGEGDAREIGAGGGAPYVVSDRDEAEVVRHQRRAGRRWAALGVVGAAALVWGALQLA
ncbi:MAG: hypothetical protein ACOZNI_37225 [Myxococcota bacterium]